jgi:hypothetical protein
MNCTRFGRSVLWPAAALLVGLAIGSMMPHSPLHGMATDSNDAFIIATGPLDQEVEGLYLLDCLTGNLMVTVPTRVGNGFAGGFRYNILADFQVNPAQKPRFLMVTGGINLALGTGAGTQAFPANALVYIAEITTGRAVVYGTFWDRNAWRAGRPVNMVLRPLANMPIRQVAAGQGGGP